MNVISLFKEVSIDFTKKRNDSITSRWNRLFGSKMLFVTTLVSALYWYKDNMQCNLVDHKIDAGFLRSACWMQGLFIYKELEINHITKQYGIPNNLANTGMRKDKTLCKNKKSCIPMKKRVITSYLWVPFFLLFCSFALKIPYFLFNWNFSRLQDFRSSVDNLSSKKIYKNFFSTRYNFTNNLYILCNLTMECLYLIVSVALFVSCTKILGNDFACYLPNLLSFDKWDERNNEGNGKYPSPLDVLFPAVGLCDVSIGRRDLITKHFNELMKIKTAIIYVPKISFILVFSSIII